ncbi:MAG: hypothetical protein Q9227_000735 [Pyrenula ochraceoflavens]
MAILNDLEVFVGIDGQTAKEYDDPDDGDNYDANGVEHNSSIPTMTKYIEAKSSASFEVVFKVKHDYEFGCDYLGWSINLDGKSVSFPIVRRSDHIQKEPKTGPHEYFRRGVKIKNDDGSWSEHKFEFANIEIEENASKERVLESVQQCQGLGTLTVTIQKMVKERKIETEQNDKLFRLVSTPEKALKGKTVSHGASLNKVPTTCPAPSTYAGTKLGPPIAIFKFKYRDERLYPVILSFAAVAKGLAGALKSLMLIPRSPTPVPLEDRDVNDLNEREMRTLIQRMKAQSADTKREKASKSAIKRERDDSPDSAPRLYKTSRMENGQPCIDLDSD